MNISNNNIFNKDSIKDKQIKVDYDYDMFMLKKLKEEKRVYKGLKQTIKLIESGETEAVYIAKDVEDQDYAEVILSLCDVYNVPKIVSVEKWHELRDLVMDCIVPSYILIEQAKRKGVEARIMPKCYVVGVKKEKIM